MEDAVPQFIIIVYCYILFSVTQYLTNRFLLLLCDTKLQWEYLIVPCLQCRIGFLLKPRAYRFIFTPVLSPPGA
jgi:hypothetical protein